MRITGTSGELRYGYYVAATIGRWEAQPSGPDSLSFEGRVVRQDDYYITQRPLSLSLQMGRTRWSWDNVGVQIDAADGTLSTSLDGSPVVEGP